MCAVALDGTPFEVQLSKDIKTFEQLRERPWALRKFGSSEFSMPS